MVIFEGPDSSTDLVFNLSGDIIDISPELKDAVIDRSKLTINSFVGLFPFKVKTVKPDTMEEFEYNDTFDFPEGEKMFLYEKSGGSITVFVTVKGGEKYELIVTPDYSGGMGEFTDAVERSDFK